MPLDDAGMHRAGLGFVFRITPVLVATLLYGLYFALLCIATRGLIQRGLNAHSNLLILSVLYMVFFCTSALLALEMAQLAGLVEMLLQPNDSSTEAKFNTFYALIARETKITGVLFECQMILGDILVMWRASAIWYNRKIVILLPLFWWGLMILNMIIHSRFCHSGVSSTNYAVVCKATDILAPVLSIMVNVSVMLLTIWKAWTMRDLLRKVIEKRKKNQVFSLFVLLVESGTIYVIMLVTDLLVTSLVVGGPESVGRMIVCISGYSTVQFVGIYPTLLIIIIHESVWNTDEDAITMGGTMSISRAYTPRPVHGSGADSSLHGSGRGGPIKFTPFVDISPTSTTEGNIRFNHP